MHPIERLRLVARLPPDEPAAVARQAAGALLGCADPAELLVACRRLLDRQPAAGPLWWMASLAVTAADPEAAVRDALTRLASDRTADALAAALAAAPSPVTVIDAWALGAPGALVAPGRLETARRASRAGVPLWATGGVGRVLPGPVFAAALARTQRHADPPAVLLPADLVEQVVTERGPLEPAVATATSDCPVAPELLV